MIGMYIKLNYKRDCKILIYFLDHILSTLNLNSTVTEERELNSRNANILIKMIFLQLYLVRLT